MISTGSILSEAGILYRSTLKGHFSRLVVVFSTTKVAQQIQGNGINGDGPRSERT